MAESEFTGAHLANLQSLQYKTPYMARILQERAKLSDPFHRHLLAISYRQAVAYDQVLSTHGGNPSGIEFRSTARQAWAFVLPDASSTGKHRIQYFDANGFLSHASYPSVPAAVEEMLREGYRIADPGALDRLSTTDAWRRGAEAAALLMDHNAGRISFQQFIDFRNAIS